MSDTLFKNALQHALENIKGVNLEGNYGTALDVLNAFNDLYACIVTFAITPDTATVVVKDSDGNTVTANQNGTYTLKEGSYKYTLTAEGYVTETDVALAISQSDVTTGTKTVTKAMVEDDTENDG